MKIFLRILAGLGIIVLAGGIVLLWGLFRASRNQPATEDVSLGVTAGNLTTCPETPNCVSTQAPASDETHYVEPISLEAIAGSTETGTGEASLGEAALRRAAEWIESQPRGDVVVREPGYLRAVFSSRIFGFKDDLELFVPEGASVLHLRSAARVGQSDMGVNRQRYQALREALTAVGP